MNKLVFLIIILCILIKELFIIKKKNIKNQLRIFKKRLNYKMNL